MDYKLFHNWLRNSLMSETVPNAYHPINLPIANILDWLILDCNLYATRYALPRGNADQRGLLGYINTVMHRHR
ncbi:hypothetical protein [Nodularia spumigena]|nr:hypothetical protein [Nodularia spumigena]MEA5523761.1 hypothetical protein [Nodularia spumigena UHCC 0143]